MYWEKFIRINQFTKQTNNEFAKFFYEVEHNTGTFKGIQ